MFFETIQLVHLRLNGFWVVNSFECQAEQDLTKVFATIETPQGKEAPVDFGTTEATLNLTHDLYRNPYFFKITLLLQDTHRTLHNNACHIYLIIMFILDVV